MSPEKTKALYDEFPELCRGKDLPPHQNTMCGFGCGDGWFNIIYGLSTVIARHAKWNKCGELNYPIADQIKEKFGNLRFHYSSDIDEVAGAVDIAEQMSLRTCEICSAPGVLHHSNNWIKTLCSGCANEKGYILCVEFGEE